MLKQIRRTIGWFFVIGLIVLLVFFLSVQSVILLQFLPSAGDLTNIRGEKIGVLSLEGPIFQVESQLEQLRDFRNDKNVKGLLLEVNSPGGAVGPSQELAAAVSRFKKTGRPVVTSIRSVGASGGYYVAASSDTIVANPGSVVGSIGVLIQLMEFKDLMGKIGVDYQVVKSGEFKDLGSPFRELDTDERQVLKNLIMNSYNQFIDHILEHRGNLNRPELEKIADGRVFTGEQAVENGLMDYEGGRQEAMGLLRKAAGVSDDTPLWEPSEGQFDFSQFSKQLTGFLNKLLPDRSHGFRLLYMMPNWSS